MTDMVQWRQLVVSQIPPKHECTALLGMHRGSELWHFKYLIFIKYTSYFLKCILVYDYPFISNNNSSKIISTL